MDQWVEKYPLKLDVNVTVRSSGGTIPKQHIKESIELYLHMIELNLPQDMAHITVETHK